MCLCTGVSAHACVLDILCVETKQFTVVMSSGEIWLTCFACQALIKDTVYFVYCGEM